MVEQWQREISQNLRTAEDLLEQGFILPAELPAYERLLQRYPFQLSRYYAGLIEKNNPHCPIRLQAIPQLEELSTLGSPDPLADLAHQPVPRITHRYPNRCLLHLTPNCSMLCRYCFRKTLLNELKGELFMGGFESALEYIKDHSEIEEVILSGGDPLMATNQNLANLFEGLDSIPHLKRLRIHTRVPVTLPSRIEPALVQLLSKTRLPLILVSHFNHPKELTSESEQACKQLHSATPHLLNQSVLLKGVNNKAAILKALSEKLFENRILPYYLHHPDPARGTFHFHLSIQEGKAIYHELRKILPGYLVPRYVIDKIDSPFKPNVE